jgi:hypothetical protein
MIKPETNYYLRLSSSGIKETAPANIISWCPPRAKEVSFILCIEK